MEVTRGYVLVRDGAERNGYQPSIDAPQKAGIQARSGAGIEPGLDVDPESVGADVGAEFRKISGNPLKSHILDRCSADSVSATGKAPPPPRGVFMAGGEGAADGALVRAGRHRSIYWMGKVGRRCHMPALPSRVITGSGSRAKLYTGFPA